jgi:hypothetical protein
MRGRLIKKMKWVPVHDASVWANNEGLLILSDGQASDRHLRHGTDRRLNDARVKLSFVARPAISCDINPYFHQWGGSYA